MTSLKFCVIIPLLLRISLKSPLFSCNKLPFSTLQAKTESPKAIQTYLSDMFGELAPPDRPKRTLRRYNLHLTSLHRTSNTHNCKFTIIKTSFRYYSRLCTSGNGKDDNFTRLFDNTDGEDGIFM